MMEGAYGRNSSAIEVLRGWVPAPPQFTALYTALQVYSWQLKLAYCHLHHPGCCCQADLVLKI